MTDTKETVWKKLADDEMRVGAGINEGLLVLQAREEIAELKKRLGKEYKLSDINILSHHETSRPFFHFRITKELVHKKK